MSTTKKPTQAQIAEWKKKAEKWDALDAKLQNIYFDEEGNEREDVDGDTDLGTIGEICAMAFGYL